MTGQWLYWASCPEGILDRADAMSNALGICVCVTNALENQGADPCGGRQVSVAGDGPPEHQPGREFGFYPLGTTKGF